MIKVTLGEKKANNLIFVVMIWLLAFQSPLESVHRIFAYIDELMACVGIACCIVVLLNYKKLKVSRNTWYIVVALTIFAATGLLGNLLFQYQPVSAVLIDLFTNYKFFFTIAAGYYLFGCKDWARMHSLAGRHGRTITLILFCAFLFDRVFNIYPGEIRYGIKSAQLFYFHSTYLAGALAFLLVLLTIFYEKKNIPYLVMNALMMAFTLRSKAIASAAAFMALFVFFVLLNKKLKLWHLACLGGACLAIGWPLINFYYIRLAGKGTRAVMTELSFVILQDYFPIGTGFGTYASSAANESFSAVYELYDLEYLCRFDAGWRRFMSDVFWPIIIGQTGFIGLVTFLIALVLLLKRCFALKKNEVCTFIGVLYVFVYLIISSTSEPAFHNAIAVPLALLLGIVFRESSKGGNCYADGIGKC